MIISINRTNPSFKEGFVFYIYFKKIYFSIFTAFCNSAMSISLVLLLLFIAKTAACPAASPTAMQIRITRYDERDARVLANMLENTEYGFFLEGARGVIESVTETDTSITSLLESNEDKYEQIVEDYMVHHYEGTVAVYGE